MHHPKQRIILRKGESRILQDAKGNTTLFTVLSISNWPIFGYRVKTRKTFGPRMEQHVDFTFHTGSASHFYEGSIRLRPARYPEKADFIFDFPDSVTVTRPFKA